MRQINRLAALIPAAERLAEWRIKKQ